MQAHNTSSRIRSALGLLLICSKACLFLTAECSTNLPIMLLDSPIIPNYSRKLPRLQVASLALRWYLNFLLISSGFEAFTIPSGLVLGIFFYRLRRLPIAKCCYVESIPPFLSLNCWARLVPRRCSDWERVAGHKMSVMLGARACLLFPKVCRHIVRIPKVLSTLPT